VFNRRDAGPPYGDNAKIMSRRACYDRKMLTPEISLSPSERLMLGDLVQGNEPGFTFDWIALQRLKTFGFVEETAHGPKITAEGRRAIGRSQDP
jgi:hypothetical protein